MFSPEITFVSSSTPTQRRGTVRSLASSRARAVPDMAHSFAIPVLRHPMVALRNTAPTCRRHAHRRVPIAGKPGDDVVARSTDSGRGARAFNRRDAIVLTTAWLSAGSAVSAPAAFAVESPQPDFAVFADAKNLFRLEYPVGWQEVNKAGATLLLRDPTQKYSQIGVTVSPVKIASLAEFGSVRDIGEKLTQAEAAKESTVPGGVTMVSEGERVGPASGTTFYEYEYRLVTTRGNKRVFNAVAVEKNVLYIMNAQVFEKGDDATAEEIAAVASVASALRRAMRAFDVGRESVAS